MTTDSMTVLDSESGCSFEEGRFIKDSTSNMTGSAVTSLHGCIDRFFPKMHLFICSQTALECMGESISKIIATKKICILYCLINLIQ